jgi:F-type H+-transporting ATPase subunit gamma
VAGGRERALRRRIRTVQSTQKITRAFELIATSQIIRAQSRIATAKPYLEGIAQILSEAANDAGGNAGRVLGVPESPNRVLVVAILADRGLCGAYNANVLRPTERLVRSGASSGISYRLITVGRKAQSYFRFRRIEVEQAFSGFSDRPSFSDAKAVAEVITPLFLEEEVDQALVVSTRFLSAGSQAVETRQLLPIPEPGAERAVGEEEDPGAGAGDGSATQPAREGYTEFEPESTSLLVELVPRYVEAAIFGALLEASASEHTARQRAMAAATDNAEELTKTLTREMNRARQDTITAEIMEIVGGAEALRRAAAEE